MSAPATEHAEKECLSYVQDLGEEVLYLNLLVTNSAVTPVDEFYRAFVMQDIDTHAKILKDEFVIVERSATKVPNGYIWHYSCSCNPARKSLVNSVSATLSECVKEFDSPYQKCCHIEVFEMLAAKFQSDEISLETEHKRRIESTHLNKSDHSYKKESIKTDIYGIDGHAHVVVVRTEESGFANYSIVRVDYRGEKPVLKCSSCFKKKDSIGKKCQHILSLLNQDYGVSDVSKILLDQLLLKPKWRSKYIPVGLSTAKIPFSPPPEEQKNNRFNLSKLMAQDGFIHLIPDDNGNCECGGEWLDETDIESTYIVCSMDILPAKVYIRSCSSCTQVRDYDGSEHQILNMGMYLVAHEVLRRYLCQFVTEGFRYAWYAFLNLQDAEYQYGFACPQCGDCPETVVMDGVTLGMRKSFLPWTKYLNSQRQANTLDGSSHNTRVFINNSKCRSLMTKFCEEDKQLSAHEYDDLKEHINLYQNSLYPFFKYFDKCNSDFKCPTIFRELFQCLSSNYPVCGFIHFNEKLFDIIEELSIGVDIGSRINDIMLIHKECPILGRILQYFEWKTPDYLWPVFTEMVKKAKAPFQCTPHKLEECSLECECPEDGLFPNLPKLCHRGDYVLDNKNKSNLGSNSRKKGSSHPTLTPGIFTLSCIHGICYGFQLMEDVESPNTPYTILRTMFHKAPRLIIYDNACNLHSYCLNRDPAFFKDTWFVVDRFHWVNHVGCHIGYNLSIYSQFNEVNTQVAEQRNATLKKLKSMLSYMNKENFINHLKIFLWFRSMVSIMKISKNLPVKHYLLFNSLLPIFSKFK